MESEAMCIHVKYKVENKGLIIAIIQLYLDYKTIGVDKEYFMRSTFNKAEFIDYAKTQLERFGTGELLTENHDDDYIDYDDDGDDDGTDHCHDDDDSDDDVDQYEDDG